MRRKITYLPFCLNPHNQKFQFLVSIFFKFYLQMAINRIIVYLPNFQSK